MSSRSDVDAFGSPEELARASPPDLCDVFSTDVERTDSVRARLLSEDTAAALAETFRALGDPTRVRILDALSGGDLCVCEIATVLGLSESAVSHQLRLLRSLRVVRSRRRGRRVFYALDDHHIRHLFMQALSHAEEPRLPASGAAAGSR
jgi:DNA-binding transcriptional ArsR family regulator